MSKPVSPKEETLYLLQHIYTEEFISRTKAGKKASYTLVTNIMDATKFKMEEANAIIAATAKDNGNDTEKGFMIIELLKAIEI